jgi:hypothetical protein
MSIATVRDHFSTFAIFHKHLYFSVYSTFKERAEIAVNEAVVKYICLRIVQMARLYQPHPVYWKARYTVKKNSKLYFTRSSNSF